MTRPQTFENLKIWENMFEEYRRIDSIKIVVGNKVDLKSER